MTKQEVVRSLAARGKTPKEISRITGLAIASVYRYLKDADRGFDRKHVIAMRPGFWDEWERAVYVIFGGHAGVPMEPDEDG